MDYIPYDFRINKIKELIKRAKVITIATSPLFYRTRLCYKSIKRII